MVRMPHTSDLPAELMRTHRCLCFARAFPRTRSERANAHRELAGFEDRINALTKSGREELADSGIVATKLHYRFSFDVARWLSKSSPGAVSIDWPEVTGGDSLDDLLRAVLQPSEDEYFDSGYASSKDWITLASAGFDGTDFDWLMAQLDETGYESMWRQLYDAANLPLVWNLSGCRYSKSGNILARVPVETRHEGMHGRPRNVKQAIQRPVESIARVSKRRGAALIDMAMASLAVRHRETYHFNFANPDEVYLANVGDGVSVAVFGLLHKHRFPLECTMGYLVLVNGVPVGYGGASLLFRQVNTGINIFDEYRKSEAAYLWVQVMRVYHSLVGCTRFIANAYQIGDGNDEALKSGAFWFYYRLGYRPIEAEARRLAIKEQAKRRRNRAYRCSLKTLRQLASCDMHLTLPGARKREYFDEEWLATSSMLATRELAKVDACTRQQAAEKLTNTIARELRINSLRGWSKEEKRALSAIAPFVAAADSVSWATAVKHRMRQTLKAKGGKHELLYAQRLRENEAFLESLQSVCRQADDSC